MDLKLKDILIKQKKALEALLELLDEQYKYIMTRDVFNMEGIVDKIRYANKSVAEIEVERRKIMGGLSISEYIQESKNENLKKEYRQVSNLIKALQQQNDTNKMLIKQDLSFTNKILSYINPNRDAITYNSYGKTIR